MDQIRYRQWFAGTPKGILYEFVDRVCSDEARQFLTMVEQYKQTVQAKQGLDIFERSMRKLYIELHTDEDVPPHQKRSLTSQIYVPVMDPIVEDDTQKILNKILTNKNYFKLEKKISNRVENRRMQWIHTRIGTMVQQNKQKIREVIKNKQDECAKLQYVLLWNNILNFITILHSKTDRNLKCKKNDKMEKVGQELLDFLDDDRRKAIQNMINQELAVEIDQELSKLTLKKLEELTKQL